MMRPQRCLICGETYLGSETPDRCPYCGVEGRFIAEAAEYVDYDGMELSETSQEFIREAIQIEMSNVAFYKSAADQAQSKVVRAIFKRVGKHEGEHLELLADHLGVEEPDIEPESCTDDDILNMKQSHDREDRAVKMYMRFAAEAPEPRIKQIFSAIAGIEQEHYKLFNTFR
ncbi:MAG: ferritin-like domain-containing protein [Planctomycetes bacterium]|nr:ferritin-like domain-containing protein [Planctomycetota bacterium]